MPQPSPITQPWAIFVRGFSAWSIANSCASSAKYIGVYAALGIANAIGMGVAGVVTAQAAIRASRYVLGYATRVMPNTCYTGNFTSAC